MKKSIKTSWMKLPASAFETLTFGELELGDKFICFPAPGDNDGHGGFRGVHHIYTKTHQFVANNGGKNALPYHEDYPNGRAKSVRSGVISDLPLSMPVIQVE
jgi:hypothetical protein